MATTTRQRIVTLDVVRGVAVMGILFMNIYAFALPSAACFNPAAYGGDNSANVGLWALEFVFVDSKMRGLFSILFGASTLLVIERAMAKSDSPAARHYTRMMWLAAFGLAHYYLIWWGDILFLYAVCGLLLFLWRGNSVKVLRNWAIGLLTVSFLIFTLNWLALSGYAASSPADRPAGIPEALAAIKSGFGTDQGAVARDLALYRADYGAILDHRTGPKGMIPFVGPLQMGLETLGLMLVGMALFKSGFLTGEWERARYRRWAIRCFLIATPVLAAMAARQVSTGFDAFTVFGATLALSMPFDVLMAIGWAALITLWARPRLDGALQVRTAAAGRMAFTNYLMTSILMTSLFYGYGAGLYGDLSRVELLGVVLAMCAAMLLWSKPWLDRFRYGPFEWLWRSLSRFELQPMRR